MERGQVPRDLDGEEDETYMVDYSIRRGKGFFKAIQLCNGSRLMIVSWIKKRYVFVYAIMCAIPPLPFCPAMLYPSYPPTLE